MNLTSRRGASPKALVGKILLFNAVVFIGISILLGGYTLLTHGNGISTVTGLLALIFVGVGLLEGLAGLLLWQLPGGASASAPVTVLNQYYIALENQDYATAFQYLDLSIEGPLGMITQDEFIQRARAYDGEHGPITNYSLAGVRANPSRRTFTIKVTRSDGTYRSQLHLMKQGYNWKIVAFDRF